MFVKALSLWFVMLVLAVGNGLFRISILIPKFGEASGHIISTILLCLLIFLLVLIGIRWVDPRSPGDTVQIGFMWVVLTLCFEFGFGRFVAHKPWPELFSDYNVAAGRIWILVLITTFAAPYLTARLRGIIYGE